MSLLANSYGDVDEIAALVPRYASAQGKFSEATNPTLANVESLADQVSALLNAALSQNGFAIPISQADARLMLDLFVNQEVAALIEGIRGSGRFGPRTGRGRPVNRFALIMDDVEDFIRRNSVGLERQGATRTYTQAESIGYRDGDEAGDAVTPVFERKAFGDDREEWDA